MKRLEISVRRRDGESRRIVLGKFATALIAVVLVLIIALVVVTALVLGYLLAGILLVSFLVIALIGLLSGAVRGLLR